MPQAFPGAYGWGAESQGGRGGEILEVTNLNASGPGSFIDALQTIGPRIIVFRVAGVINIADTSVIEPSVTVAGQTAPGSGIVLRGGHIDFFTHNVIVRYISFRGTGKAEDEHFIQLREGCHDAIFDHLSGCWALDDLHSCNMYKGTEDMYNVTWQNCIFGNPNPSHPTAMHVTSSAKYNGAHHFSVHNNLFSSSGHRNPNVRAATSVEIVNNFVYNWKSRILSWDTQDIAGGARDLPGTVEIDFVNNYWLAGPHSTQAMIYYDDRFISTPDDPVHSIYLSGNIVPVLTPDPLLTEPLNDPGDDNWPLLQYQSDKSAVNRVHQRTSPLPQPPYPIPVVSAADARVRILATAGNNARLNANGTYSDRRDSVDDISVNEAKNDAGPSGYPNIPGTSPLVDSGVLYVDTDKDGMPDVWEVALGLNPADPTDGPTIGPDGYSNVEVFLNSLEEPMSVVTDLQAVEVALRQEALDLTAQADAVAKVIVDLRAHDDVLDAAADVIEAD